MTCASVYLQIQEVQQTKETILTSNRSLAEQNLVLQPTLEEQKNQLTKRYCLLQEGFEAYQLRKSTLGNLPESPDTKPLASACLT